MAATKDKENLASSSIEIDALIAAGGKSETNKVYVLIGFKVPLYDLNPINEVEKEVKNRVHSIKKMCDHNKDDFTYCPDCGERNWETFHKKENIFLYDTDVFNYKNAKIKDGKVMEYIMENNKAEAASNFTPIVTPSIDQEKTVYFVYKICVKPFNKNPIISITGRSMEEAIKAKNQYLSKLTEKSRKFMEDKEFGVFCLGISWDFVSSL